MAIRYSKRDKALREARKMKRIVSREDSRGRPRLKGYFFPLEALELAEDTERLALVLALLDDVDADSISDSDTVEKRQHNEMTLRSTRALIRLWHRYAQNKMKREYLSNT